MTHEPPGGRPSLRLREFAAGDIPAARLLWLDTPGVGLSAADEPPAIAQFLDRNPGTSFVAMSEGRVVGTILCGHDGRRGLIHHLVCASSLRRQGIGRQLLHCGLQALREAGIDKCHLLVFRSNAEGLAFWWAVEATERQEMALFSLSTRDNG